MLGPNEMDIRVLPDGVIRVETGDMGGVSHQQVDDFLEMVKRLMGGDVTVTELKPEHQHLHDHTHEHGHDHLHQ